MNGLEAGLRRVAKTRRLLVASDFDGTLAPLVDRPDAVVPDPGAVAALVSLAELPETHVAVVSGRSRGVLEEHLGHANFILAGSHGAELAGLDGQRDDVEEVLGRVAERLDALVDEYGGALVERKPTAVAFHYRQVDEERQTEAADRATAVAGEFDVVRIQPGHKVVELVTGTVNKGDALEAIRRELDATGTVFVGDDRTDEHAFARLQPSDLGVKIGSGSTCAPVRIASQSEVAPLYRRLLALRAP
ncbi:MAG: trehalose-phosphatase [Gemmatimonadota bacterium]